MSPAISLMLLQTLHHVKLCTDVNDIILIIAFGFRVLNTTASPTSEESILPNLVTLKQPELQTCNNVHNPIVLFW